MFIYHLCSWKNTKTDFKFWIPQPGISEGQTEPQRLCLLRACKEQGTIQTIDKTHTSSEAKGFNLPVRPGGSSWVILWAVAAAHSGHWMHWMYFIMVFATLKVSPLEP